MATPTLDALRNIYRFDETDLAANANGDLTARQVGRLRRMQVEELIAVVALFVVVLLVAAGARHPRGPRSGDHLEPADSP